MEEIRRYDLMKRSRTSLMTIAKERKLKHLHDMNKAQLADLIIKNEQDSTVTYLPEMREKVYKNLKRSLNKYKDADIVNIIRKEPKIKKMRKTMQDEATNARQRKIELNRKCEDLNREALEESIENTKKEVEAGLYKDTSEAESNEDYWDDITEEKIHSGKYDRSPLNQLKLKKKQGHVLDQIKKMRDQAKTIDQKKYLKDQLNIIKTTLMNNIIGLEYDCQKLEEAIKDKDEHINEQFSGKTYCGFPVENVIFSKDCKPLFQ